MDIADIQDIPRHQPENHYNYTAVQLAERKKALIDLQRDYPHLPYAWLEMTYDWHKNTPNEEVEKIMNEGLWEGNGREHPKEIHNDTKLKEIM
tara:strand:- start:5376 stop:5654 length:279 start_codon:yes stop_codon:yes gene_type:complete